MGSLKDLNDHPGQQPFPAATFEIVEDVPQSQCSEAKIEGDHGQIWDATATLYDSSKFSGWNLIGKKVTVLAPISQAGTYNITNNSSSSIITDHLFTMASTDVEYYIHNGGSLILTRNLKSFAEFIKAAGYAYTIKGSKLYTDIPSVDLQPACSILFDPLT